MINSWLNMIAPPAGLPGGAICLFPTVGVSGLE
jgi:hypothetical protein